MSLLAGMSLQGLLSLLQCVRVCVYQKILPELFNLLGRRAQEFRKYTDRHMVSPRSLQGLRADCTVGASKHINNIVPYS